MVVPSNGSEPSRMSTKGRACSGQRGNSPPFTTRPGKADCGLRQRGHARSVERLDGGIVASAATAGIGGSREVSSKLRALSYIAQARVSGKHTYKASRREPPVCVKY